ncbi:hypothetical protein PV336_41645 [Streptomyces sp. MI02-2A]|uniref:hypothetical protein n=1 Tax=unclassified Streptomyces TaxID=2593676 RepID=UPI0029BA730C|nr:MULTISPECIES: hypothetical protein [unclassified Streptomyces]MDX3265603.1 hypothetical protein [Streptomyces sp. MI02-2A]
MVQQIRMKYCGTCKEEGGSLPIINVRRQKGIYMEIVISAGKVTSGAEEFKTPQAAKARRIANYLPRPELLRDAVIEHNRDDNTTSIRFDTTAGPVRILLPVAEGFEFNVIHDSDTGPRILGSFRGDPLSVRAIAFRISEFLRTRGLK